MKKKILTIASVCLILMLATLPMACGEVTPTPTPTPGPEPTPGPGPTPPTPPPTGIQYGGTLKISRPQAFRSVMPTTMARSDAQVNICPTIETLIHYDEVGAPMPWLATSWEADAEAKTYTIQLREGVKFHDGTDFNAEACKWNLDLYRATGRSELKTVESIDIIDDYTIRLNLSEFDNLIVTNLGIYPGMMISPAAYEKYGEDWCELHAVGTGPFKLVSIDIDVVMKFERFDDYWQEGKPYLDAIEIYTIADPVVLLAAYLRGDNDIMLALTPKDAADLEASGKQVIAQTASGTEVACGDGVHPESPYADIKVRQAVVHAIDKQAICDTIGYGYWQPAPRGFARPGGWADNPDVVGYPYNPAKARELLAEAGYPDGFKTHLNVVNQPRSLVDAVTAMQGYLADVGVDAAFGADTPGSEFAVAVKGGWEDGIYCWGMGLYAPDETMTLNRLFAPGTILFRSKYVAPEFQDVLAEAVKVPSFEEKARLTRELQYLMVDKYAMIDWVWNSSSLKARYPEIHGDGLYEGTSASHWTPQDAWIER